MTFVALRGLSVMNYDVRLMTFVGFDVCRIMTLVCYDVCRIMTFSPIMTLVAYNLPQYPVKNVL